MATKTNTVYIDDITGEELPPGSHRPTTIGFNGAEYELDLSPKSRDQLAKLLEPYLTAGRRVGKPRRVPADTQAVRDWAASQGIKVSKRGRVPAEVLAAYRSAH